jgi:hypothetical protein
MNKVLFRLKEYGLNNLKKVVEDLKVIDKFPQDHTQVKRYVVHLMKNLDKIPSLNVHTF